MKFNKMKFDKDGLRQRSCDFEKKIVLNVYPSKKIKKI